MRGNDLGWGSATHRRDCSSAAAVLMVAFFVNERFTSDPMLDLGLFKIPAFVGVSVVAFTLAASIFAMFLYLTLYIQDDLGYGPLAAGVRFLPLTLLAFIVALFAGRLTVRVQSRFLLGHRDARSSPAGLLLMGTTHPDSTWTVLLPGFIVCGLGIGIVNPVLASGAISVVQPQRSGMASGANNTFRQVGIATGIAVLGAVFQSQIVAHTSAAPEQDDLRARGAAAGRSAARGALAAGEVQQVAASIPVPARTPRAAQRLSRRLLEHDQPPDGHRRRGGLRGRAVRVHPGAPDATSWSPPAVVPATDRVAGRAGGSGGRGARRACLSRSRWTGTFVRLEPLSESHIPALVEAAAEDRANYQWTYTPDGPEQMTVYVHDALAKVATGAHVAFATVRKGAGPGGSDRVVGATRFCEIAFWQWPPGATHQRHGVPDVVDIGFTWLAGSAQRTAVNTEAKLLMMTHAFEVWQVHRVALQTDVRNTRSRAAIERIGGQLDGILRADRPGADDTVRTSARFSIVAAEWPDVKARLTARLEAAAAP